MCPATCLASSLEHLGGGIVCFCSAKSLASVHPRGPRARASWRSPPAPSTCSSCHLFLATFYVQLGTWPPCWPQALPWVEFLFPLCRLSIPCGNCPPLNYSQFLFRPKIRSHSFPRCRLPPPMAQAPAVFPRVLRRPLEWGPGPTPAPLQAPSGRWCLRTNTHHAAALPRCSVVPHFTQNRRKSSCCPRKALTSTPLTSSWILLAHEHPLPHPFTS